MGRSPVQGVVSNVFKDLLFQNSVSEQRRTYRLERGGVGGGRETRYEMTFEAATRF
jgi:hypothetical protein